MNPSSPKHFPLLHFRYGFGIAVFIFWCVLSTQISFAQTYLFECTCLNTAFDTDLGCTPTDTKTALDTKCKNYCQSNGSDLDSTGVCTASGSTPGTPWLTDPLGLFTGPTAKPEQAPVTLATRVVSAVLLILGAGAFVMFLYGGAMYLFSAGSSKAVETGKKVLVYASIGLIIIFGSYAILSFVFKVLTGS